MRLPAVLQQNSQKSPEIRAEKRLEVIRRALRNQDAVGFEGLPVLDSGGHSTLHSREASPQVFLLRPQRHLQEPLEEFLVTLFQGLLHGSRRINRFQSRMFIAPAR